MVQSRCVALLKCYRLDVVSLCFLELTNFVPTKGSVVVALEMLTIKLNGSSIVMNSILVIPLLPVSEAPIVIEVCFGTLKLYCLGETMDSFIKVTFAIETDSLIVVGESIIGVDTNRS